ncbi:MAG TPA: polymer-forming cytoskeletal protein [Pyrinomonadaceae bacterium]|nr:polymer-forming cytoskeletal protein [Pyrinomonadaceae bacterium]
MPAPESSTVSTRESFLNDSSRGEFADFLLDTTPYFEAWLESLRPSPKPIDGPAPASQLKFEGTLRLDCSVSGVVHSRTGTLTVGETAELQANIFVATAIIDGLVRGDIRATERVELGSTARVIGNIETPALSIQPGAVFEGQCHFLSPPSKSGNEKNVRSSVRKSTVSRRSRRSPPGPDSEEKPEAMAVAAGR